MKLVGRSTAVVLLPLMLAGLSVAVTPTDEVDAAAAAVVRKHGGGGGRAGPTKVWVYDRGSGFLRVKWRSGHASAGIARYCVRIPGPPHSCTKAQRITLRGLKPHTRYRVQVRLKDRLGRFSGWTTTRASTKRKPVRWTHPLPGAWVTSCFGPRGGTFHKGIDMDKAYRAPVRAASGGAVVGAGLGNTGYGRHVVVSHGDGMYTRYAHLDSVATRKGQRVRAGQMLGRQGSTGWTQGDHLHFEVWKGGWHKPVNPAPFLSARGVHMRRCQ
jgi:hypothetical protein